MWLRNLKLSNLNHFMNSFYLFLVSPSSISGILFLKLSRLWKRWFNTIMPHSISLPSLGAVNSHLNHSGDKRALALAELWQVAATTSKSSSLKNEITQQLLNFLCLCLRCLNASNSCLWGAKCKIRPLRYEPSGNRHSVSSPSLFCLQGSASALTAFLSMRRLEEKATGWLLVPTFPTILWGMKCGLHEDHCGVFKVKGTDVCAIVEYSFRRNKAQCTEQPMCVCVCMCITAVLLPNRSQCDLT